MTETETISQRKCWGPKVFKATEQQVGQFFDNQDGVLIIRSPIFSGKTSIRIKKGRICPQYDLENKQCKISEGELEGC